MKTLMRCRGPLAISEAPRLRRYICTVPYTTVYFPQLNCSTTKRGTNTERCVFGKLPARGFQRLLFLAPPLFQLWRGEVSNAYFFSRRHCSNCGDINHGTSTPGGGGYTCTVVCGISPPKRVSRISVGLNPTMSNPDGWPRSTTRFVVKAKRWWVVFTGEKQPPPVCQR